MPRIELFPWEEARAHASPIRFSVFVEEQGVSLEEGSVKKTTHSVSQGVGVRVLAGEKTGYAYSDEVTVEPGDLLCLYSDGITEAESPEEEEHGTERLCERALGGDIGARGQAMVGLG